MVFIYHPPNLTAEEVYQLHFVSCVLSNMSLVPLAAMIVQLCRVRVYYYWDTILGTLCVIASTLYHWTERVQDREVFGAGEETWHILDNIFSQTCTCTIFMLPIDFSNVADARVLLLRQIVFLIIVIAQTIQPFNILYTAVPICAVLCGIPFLGRRLGFLPLPDKRYIILILLIFLMGGNLFVRGMDEQTDPCRMYHGAWHIIMGCASTLWYQAWRVGEHHMKKSELSELQVEDLSLRDVLPGSYDRPAKSPVPKGLIAPESDGPRRSISNARAAAFVMYEQV